MVKPVPDGEITAAAPVAVTPAASGAVPFRADPPDVVDVPVPRELYLQGAVSREEPQRTHVRNERGIVDLTDGEPTPGSHGPEVRLEESRQAAETLGAEVRVTLDLPNRRLDVLVDEATLAERRANWKPIEPRYPTGALGKYARLVGSAGSGAVLE